jgi:L-malate glycosyltransferase
VRILHLTTFLQGGAGLAIAELATRQQRAGHSVTVVTSKTAVAPYGNYPAHLQRLVEASVPVHTVDSLFRRDFSANLNVVSFIQRQAMAQPFDIIHAHAAVPSCIALVAASGGPTRVLQTMHGWGIRKTPAQAQADLTVMRQLPTVVVPSDQSRRLLAGFGIAPEAITVIPYGVSGGDELIESQGAADADLLAIRNIRARGQRVVSCIGTVGDRKNQRLLLDALTAIPRASRPVCVFVGEGEAGVLAAAAQRLGVGESVRFLGHKPNARRFLRESDAMVLPSVSEGLPLSVLEAFCERVPVVTSDIPELVEVVHDRETGMVFESNHAQSLASALVEVLGLPAEQRSAMCDRAHSVYRDRFTAAMMADRYQLEYLRLLDRSIAPLTVPCAA